MFPRAGFNKIRGVESFLGEFEWDSRRRDHASSGACDKGVLPKSNVGKEGLQEGDYIYTIYAPAGTLDVLYESEKPSA